MVWGCVTDADLAWDSRRTGRASRVPVDLTRTGPPTPRGPLRSRGDRRRRVANLAGFRARESVVHRPRPAARRGAGGVTVRPTSRRRRRRAGPADLTPSDRPSAGGCAVSRGGRRGHRCGPPHRALAGARARCPTVAGPEALLVARAGPWWSYDCPARRRARCRPRCRGVTAAGGGRRATGWSSGGPRRPPRRIRLQPAFAAAPWRRPASAGGRLDCSADGISLAAWDHGDRGVLGGHDRRAGRVPGRDAGGPLTGDAETPGQVGPARRRRPRPGAELALAEPDAAAPSGLWTASAPVARAPPAGPAPATLLAVSAWLRGDGAMANVALTSGHLTRRRATPSPACSPRTATVGPTGSRDDPRRGSADLDPGSEG